MFSVATIEDFNLKACEYSTAGRYTTRVTVYDPLLSPVFTSSLTVYVAAPYQLARTVRSVLTTMLGRLKDGNLDAALNSIARGCRDQFKDRFTSLGSELSAAASQFGQIRKLSLAEDAATILVTRDMGDGPQVFYVHFYRGADGIWRIDSM